MMEAIVRQVRDLNSAERSAIERLIGQTLEVNQKLLIQVLSGAADAKLPDWCRVYEGLSDQQIAELEEVVLKRADLSRST